MATDWRRLLDDLVSERRGALVGYAFLYTGNLSAAEDLVHDAILRTFSKPRRLGSVPEAEAYVKRAIVTTFLNSVKRKQRFRERMHLVAAADRVADDAEELGARDEVHTAVLGLPPRERACIVLRHFEAMPIRDIADALGLAEGSVKRYLSDATTTLRARLGDRAPDDTGVDPENVAVESHQGGRR